MVDSLLSDKDLRKRGLAAYSIVERSGPERFRILEKMLSDDAELVRFDAISALALKGGAEGKQMLQKQALVEKQPRLKALINVALTQALNKLLVNKELELWQFIADRLQRRARDAPRRRDEFRFESRPARL